MAPSSASATSAASPANVLPCAIRGLEAGRRHSGRLEKLAAEIRQGDAGGVPPRAEGNEGQRRRRAENRDRSLDVILMVRRRTCAVSNHEATMRPHPSRRGEDTAPQDEGRETMQGLKF